MLKPKRKPFPIILMSMKTGCVRLVSFCCLCLSPAYERVTLEVDYCGFGIQLTLIRRITMRCTNPIRSVNLKLIMTLILLGLLVLH